MFLLRLIKACLPAGKIILFIFSLPLLAISQKKVEKKYPSLLWEITGNGLKKPSYLFGTMHVSSKLAFHLPDSFYHALRSVDAVALELNPDVWQGEMVRLDQLQMNYRKFTQPPANEYLTEKSFQLEEYDDELKTALSSEPIVVNGLLYRTYKAKEDFEEDTFLDLYIFQTGKKLGKRATGVENYYETEKLILEAYSDMAREKKKKTVDTDGESMYDIAQKTQDAYRRGDLDLLDSLDYMMERSIAFRNKFLYKRNEIQANSIDTIIKKNSLFVGVGAAHLAGPKGVIELLREKGYVLRPVLMADRDATQKDQIDKMKVPVKFITNTNDDGFYKVDVPGPLYKMATDISGLDRRQYADMSNGAYYLVTRVKTHAAFTGNSEAEILKRTDSLLYENIPGKILRKTPITKNGYRGLDIVNKTRRGDIQRYQIFITPFEVVLFKMSGKEGYVQGPEAEKYFSSIQLRPAVQQWVDFQPAQGGFKVKLPHYPDIFLNKSSSDAINRWEYESVDKRSGNAYLLFKKSVSNFRYLEEDTFDLVMMEESFKLSEIFRKQTSRKLISFKGHAGLDVTQKGVDGSTVKARFIIHGPHYYLLAARSASAEEQHADFFNSFEFTPYKYGKSKSFNDTFIKYTVKTPVIPEFEENLRAVIEKITEDNPGGFGSNMVEPYWPKSRNALFYSDSTGEKIGVSMQQYPRYYFIKDSATFWKDEVAEYMTRNDMKIIRRDSFRLDDMHAYWFTLGDTNSSRRIQRLWILNHDRMYRLVTLTDSTLQPSSFVSDFWSTFKPFNNGTLNLYNANLNQFFKDLFSSDSIVRTKAKSSISNIYYRKQDIPKLLSVINTLKYGDKDYFDSKSRFIAELGYIKDSTASDQIIAALKDIYDRTADTSTFQNKVLQSLARLKTKSSYALLKELVLLDPPVFESEYEYNTFFTDMEDSLPLAKQLFPEILQLSSIQDYKENVNSLLTSLIDRGLIDVKDYESYYTNIYFDARIEMKKLQARDEKRMEVENSKEEGEKTNYGENSSSIKLNELAVLLISFYDMKPPVKKFFDQLLMSRDKGVQLQTAVLLLKHKKAVSNELLSGLSSSDRYRSQLYRGMEKAGVADKFPLAYLNQMDMARSILVSEKSFDKIDSVAFIQKQTVSHNGKRGIVYFFKYRIKKEDDWKIGISGLQPDTVGKVSSNSSFTKMTDKKLRTDEPLDEQLNLQLKRLMFSLRKSSKNFYTDGGGRFKRSEMED